MTSEHAENATWERDTINQMLFEYVKEQRRRRRWGIFFKLLFLLWLILFLLLLVPRQHVPNEALLKPHVGLIDITGGIFAQKPASADNISTSLRHAFSDKKTVAVILRINSPGGSPVQADYIFNEITRLRKKYPDTKVYAVCTDMCASAAYFIASAADKVYANPLSLIGSIGALYNGFGFTPVMKKLGVERRLFTAGAQKGFLDPFSPLNSKDVKHIKAMLQTTQQRFIEQVKRGRGARLQNNPDLFSGVVWTGDLAKSLGLIDGFGSAGDIARDVVKNEYIINYTIKPGLLERLSKQMSTQASQAFVNALGLKSGIYSEYRQ